MLVLHDDVTLVHDTVELLGAKIIRALETPERVIEILHTLRSSQHHIQRLSLECYETGLTDEERLQRVNAILASHDPGYIEHLRTVHDAWVAARLVDEHESILPECFPFPTRVVSREHPPVKPTDIYALAGYFAFDMSTGIMYETFRSALASAHLAYSGVDVLSRVGSRVPMEDPWNDMPQDVAASIQAVAGSNVITDVLSLCRPPGHHCDTKRAGGYCYLNNAVVAVERWLVLHPLTRVGILDIDFHHGNGTQEYFYARSDVLYVSIHGEHEYPYYTGAEYETGIGEGTGYNVNLPLTPKSSVEAYMKKLSTGLARLETFKPDFLLVSLGFDTYRLDPLGAFDINTQDYAHIASVIRERLTDMPALILLEGGYVVEKLGENLLSFLRGWEAVG